MNDDGSVETNPDVAYQSGKLMPLGGIELNSGYKGYGLGMLVEVLCGILSGKIFNFWIGSFVTYFSGKFLQMENSKGYIIN